MQHQKTRRIRVLFVLPSLRGGGAERVISTIASKLPADDFDCHLALVRAEGSFLDALAPHVRLIDLGARRTIRAAWPLMRLIRNERFDVVVTSPSHISGVIGLVRRFLPRETAWVAREASHNTAFEQLGAFSRSMRWVVQHAYRQVDSLVCLSQAMCAEVTTEFGVDRSRTRIIGNPFHPSQRVGDATEFHLWPQGSHPRILGVGRLSHEKGFDRLIAAFPVLLRRHPESRLVILGEGNLRSQLESQIRDFGIEHRVQMPGFQPPGDWFRTCDLFVLPSRVEGFSNTLLEAVAAEVPVVSLDHPGGTSEIMHSIGIQDRMVSCLSTWSESWFERPPHSVAARANELFGIDHVIDQYAGLLRDLSRVPVRAA